MRKYVIDTDIYIGLLRTGTYYGLIEEIYVNETPGIYFSSVVIEELLAGVNNISGRRNVETLYKPFERTGRIITPTHQIWKDSGDVISALRMQNPAIKTKLSSLLNDVLIALSARSIGATVCTSNSQDFNLIQQVKPFNILNVPQE